MKRVFAKSVVSFLPCLIGSVSAWADGVEEFRESDQLAYIEPLLLTRGDSLPVESFEDSTDPYLEGYIQALVDTHFYEYRVIVTVKDHKVYLSNLPKNELIATSISNFVKDLPGVQSVEAKEISLDAIADREKYVEQPRVNGIWFPQTTVLFLPLMADPREPYYFAAYRYGDHVIGTEAASIALGDDFPFFRWRDVGPWHGALQIGIQGGIWSVFNFHDVPHKNDETCELVNTDYFGGIPLTYACDRWSFRLKVYHISSHLGDEFICNHPEYVYLRKNPSYEALEFLSSYQLSGSLRTYFGPGFILHSDKSFPMDTFYAKYGVELRILGHKLYYHQLYGTPFLAIHMENWQVRDWNLDLFLKLGYELSKLSGLGRKMRIYLDYHHGYSYEGQFFLEKTQYGEVGFSWGF
ncbi:MAG: DUF1207 domain-containing protein [Rhabdochlamydiaceae bacterium]|nr:DUF1207 domain-containing protein [Rhabdochlamydiaceae bacterium]